MSKNHSFDHVNALGGKKPKDAAARARFSASRAPVHYGKKFAQTEQLYQAHEMEHQLEELVRRDTGEELAVPAVAKPSLEPSTPARPLPPIGAIPPQTSAPGLASLKDVLADATRELRALEGAVRDFSGAATRLLKLPLTAAKLTVARLAG